MDRKILIMVLSSRKGQYKDLMRAQQCTWAVDDSDVMTAFYYGVDEDAEFDVKHNEYPFLCSDDYYRMHWKFKKALQKFLWRKGWDIIFRTNSSAYVNIPNLKKFIESLPTEKLYAGWTLEDSNDDGGLCVSGAGIFLTRDCADILLREIEDVEIEEDVYIGRILRKHGIVAIDDKSRIDYPFQPQRWHTAYHVRFKSNDRLQDASDMISFHKKIIQ